MAKDAEAQRDAHYTACSLRCVFKAHVQLNVALAYVSRTAEIGYGEMLRCRLDRVSEVLRVQREAEVGTIGVQRWAVSR